MKSKTRRILFALLALLFVGSGSMALWQGMQLQQSKAVYAEAERLVSLPELPTLPEEPVVTPVTPVAPVDPYTELLSTLDLSALQAINSEVLGWILIPNTNISYPLMQGGNNSYYLKHDFRKNASSPGSIFLDSRNKADLTDFNSIVYGHRMKNGTMFEALKGYKEQSFWEAHPDIYLVLPQGAYHYRIYAAYEDSVRGESYRTDFDGDAAQKQAFLTDALKQSWIQSDVVPQITDRLLTLSTCTGRGYDKRLVVHAKWLPTVAAETPLAETPPEALP